MEDWLPGFIVFRRSSYSSLDGVSLIVLVRDHLLFLEVTYSIADQDAQAFTRLSTKKQFSPMSLLSVWHG